MNGASTLGLGLWELVGLDSINDQTDAYIILILGTTSLGDLNICRTSTACFINLDLHSRTPTDSGSASCYEGRSHGSLITLALLEVIDS